MRPLTPCTIIAVLCTMLLWSCETRQTTSGERAGAVRVEIQCDQPGREAPLQFAAAEIERHARGRLSVSLVVRTDASLPRDGESYTLTREGNAWRVEGNGVRGAMYGGLEIAEHLQLYGSLDTLAQGRRDPFLGVRDYKFNLPLAGTGYLSAEAEERNAYFYDIEFWQRFFEMCARNRYNQVSLWASNPWFHMVRVKKYPEGQQLSDEELDKNIAYFHKIFQMAQAHGVDICIFTWNVYVSPNFAARHNLRTVGDKAGGIASGTDQWSELVLDYMAECVKEALLEYPEIKVLGTTPGENMRMSAARTSEWIAKTYLEGIRRSGRNVPFNIRYWGGQPKETQEWIAGKHSPVYLDIKYNGESMYSDTKPHFYDYNAPEGQSWLAESQTYEVVWHLRNDNLFLLRWGRPQFAREVVRNCKKYHGGGFLVGSEIEIPGEDYVSRPEVMARRNWKYMFERHWLRFMIWGRLGYNPDLPDALFERHFQVRFGDEVGRRLFAASNAAGDIFPLSLRFHWNYMNGDTFIEGNLGPWNTGAGRGRNYRFYNPQEETSRFHDVLEWMFNHTIDDDYQNIAQYVTAQLQGKTLPGMTPGQVADRLEAYARETIAQLDATSPERVVGSHGEYLSTVDDLRATAYMGLYYAEKIRGAVALMFLLATGDEARRAEAVAHLQKALEHWKVVAGIGLRNYIEHEIWLQGRFSWAMYTPEAEKDIEFARKLSPAPESFRKNPFWSADNCYVPMYNFLNLAPFGIYPNLRVSMRELESFSTTNASALVFGRNSAAMRTLPEDYGRALLARVEDGLTLIIFNQDFPGVSLRWLPGRLRGTDTDGDLAKVAVSHPLVSGVSNQELRFANVVNDALDVTGFNGWLELISPGVLAVRDHGKGRIVLCQLPVLKETQQPACQKVLANLLKTTGVSAEKPWIILDWGMQGELREVVRTREVPIK